MARRTCFVISPIGDAGSAAGKRADQVFKHVIKPVAVELRYRTKHADRMKRPGVITSKVLAAVAEADLVVADLTDLSPSVFYALAIRHAAQRPVVQLIDAAQETPFDVANMRTIHVDIHDLDSAEAAREELMTHVRAAESDSAPVETPLVAARSMKRLWSSKEPADRFIIEALDELHALRRDRQRRDQRARRAQEASQALGEFTASPRTANTSPITGAKVSVTGRPSTIDFDAGLFASTNESETADARDPAPT
jgi:uncharacterized protein YdaU (DUF1376 family)